METPLMSASEAKTQQTFSALMWSLSYPGRRHALSRQARAYPANFLAVGETLLDLETSFYTADTYLAQNLAKTGAKFADPATASYQFYSLLTEADFASIAQAPTGSLLYPDQGATLIFKCDFDLGIELGLKGPGIKGMPDLKVAGIPHQFWTLRQEMTQYPLGWDIFLLSGNTVVGLPRSTEITVASSTRQKLDQE